MIVEAISSAAVGMVGALGYGISGVFNKKAKEAGSGKKADVFKFDPKKILETAITGIFVGLIIWSANVDMETAYIAATSAGLTPIIQKVVKGILYIVK